MITVDSSEVGLVIWTKASIENRVKMGLRKGIRVKTGQLYDWTNATQGQGRMHKTDVFLSSAKL